MSKNDTPSGIFHTDESGNPVRSTMGHSERLTGLNHEPEELLSEKLRAYANQTRWEHDRNDADGWADRAAALEAKVEEEGRARSRANAAVLLAQEWIAEKDKRVATLEADVAHLKSEYDERARVAESRARDQNLIEALKNK